MCECLLPLFNTAAVALKQRIGCSRRATERANETSANIDVSDADTTGVTSAAAAASSSAYEEKTGASPSGYSESVVHTASESDSIVTASL
jgi:hypothetical protein